MLTRMPLFQQQCRVPFPQPLKLLNQARAPSCHTTTKHIVHGSVQFSSHSERRPQLLGLNVAPTRQVCDEHTHILLLKLW